jgi:hypothetical protein
MCEISGSLLISTISTAAGTRVFDSKGKPQLRRGRFFRVFLDERDLGIRRVIQPVLVLIGVPGRRSWTALNS